MTPTSIVAYLALFVIASCGFLAVHLAIGRLVRANEPNDEKQAIYECGEPTIGSSFVQFDLRFYVVALLFIIFDVEVAFFFPWATVFGKATHLMDPKLPKVVAQQEPGFTAPGPLELSPEAMALYTELGVPAAAMPVVDQSRSRAANDAAIEASARRLALISMGDILAFFGILLVGFAYVWMRGDLDWVRAMTEQHKATPVQTEPVVLEEPPVLTA